MLKLEIYYDKNKLDTIEVEEKTSALEIIKDYKSKLDYPIYAC